MPRPEAASARPAPAPAAWALRGLLRVYQLSFSALFGRTCRHLPTCSEYADEAIGRHGAWPGLWMALARFARCHPFGTQGLDPVPADLPRHARWYTPWLYGVWSGRNIVERFEDG